MYGPRNFSLSGITLASTYPQLRALGLISYKDHDINDDLPPEEALISSDFFERHPQIEQLDLDTNYDINIQRTFLPNLKALHVINETLQANPNIFSSNTKRPIRQLRRMDP